jgi:ubiquitin carboxyl-terminal hydrolase 9/24
MVPVILDGLTDDELKKEAKNESKNDAISAIIKAAKCLVSRVPNEEEMVKSLEIFRLKMILRYASYIVMLTVLPSESKNLVA